MPEHILYTDDDHDAPDVILDRNGQVTLDLCKVCGAGEIELLQNPTCPKPSEMIEKLLVDIQPWLQVREELLDIMRVYDEQMAKNGYVDTPGDLEHMGDVWNLLSGWRDMIK